MKYSLIPLSSLLSSLSDRLSNSSLVERLARAHLGVVGAASTIIVIHCTLHSDTTQLESCQSFSRLQISVRWNWSLLELGVELYQDDTEIEYHWQSYLILYCKQKWCYQFLSDPSGLTLQVNKKEVWIFLVTMVWLHIRHIVTVMTCKRLQ